MSSVSQSTKQEMVQVFGKIAFLQKSSWGRKGCRIIINASTQYDIHTHTSREIGPIL